MIYYEDELSQCQPQCWLEGSYRPISTRIATKRAKREVALAEIDGIHAGLLYLEETEKHLCTAPTVKEPWFDAWQPPYVPDFTDASCHIPDISDVPEELMLVDSTQISKAPQQQEDVPKHQEKADPKERAWLGLRSLRLGIQNEFWKLESLRSASACPKIAKLGDYYPDAEALGQMGILTYRDVLHGVLPETLAEVFSFACLSFVMSTLMFRQGRIRGDQILAGLHHWRDCIYDDEERLALDTLASSMWPQNVSSDYNQPTGQDPSGDFPPTDAAFRNPDSSSLTCDPQACPDTNNASEAFMQAADLTSVGLEFLSAPSMTGLMSDLEQDAFDLLGTCHEEFNFAQFCNIEGDINKSGSRTVQDHHVTPALTNHRDLTQSWFGPIPRYSNAPFCSPLSFPTYAPIPTEYPFRDPPSHTDDSQPKIEHRALEITSDHPIFTLRNTDMFLVVLAFGKENGAAFFSFSGNGQTVVCERRGSAFTSVKSKQEKRLQEEFFEPLRRAMSENPSFVALLSVAKRFVLLGNMGTIQEIHVFLVNIAEVG
ncbi:hypothetical protein IL306_010529 [Fusarium sp. DS 682]|nr:hypothetical protein IL306_010529 [Fusarium sp. DS 682]